MKVLLIRPPVPKYTIGLKHIMICEPLELEYIAAGLTRHEVKIMDMILERGLLKVLKEFKPDVIGASCYITGVNEAIKVCRKVKTWNPACYTVIGGVHASIVPEDFLDASVDCIVTGDGTFKMAEIVNSLENNIPLESIGGLALPGNGEETIRFTRSEPYMIDPDQLPLPRRDLTAHLKRKYYYLFHQPVTLMKTTWGCWYRCNFCFNWKVTKGVPYSRSPESIVQELLTIDTEDVYIADDIFLINPKRLLKLAELIKKNNIKKKYLVYSRADFINKHEEIIRQWSEIGLTAVIIGLEASTDQELEAMNKECTADFNRNAVKILRRYGVDTYGSLIPQPDFNESDWQRLKRFIDETGLYYVNISPLTPMPGTDIWEEYKDKLIISTKAHGLWDLSHVVIPTKMPLKQYYRSLLKIYITTILNIRRANRLTLRTRPPVVSYKYLRLWSGAFKIMFQFLSAHRHHNRCNMSKALYKGPNMGKTNESIMDKKLMHKKDIKTKYSK